jgi:hypothetical protein
VAAADSPAVVPPERLYFSPWATAVYAALTAALVGFFYSGWGSPLANLERPEASLERLVSREMDFRDALGRVPSWERRLHELTGSDPETFEDAIGRFDELDEEQRSVRTDLNLVVLLGEAGLLERAGSLIEALDGADAAAARYAGWLEAAYLAAPTPEEATAMADEIHRELPRDWFTDTLVRRIATRVDDQALQDRAEAAVEARGRELLMRVRLLGAVGAAVLALSLVAAWRLRRSPGGARVGEAPLPPPWRGSDGLGLFFRSAFAYLLIPAAAVLLLPRTAGATALMGLMGGADAWWARHTGGATVRDTFGLRCARQARVGHSCRLSRWGEPRSASTRWA